MVRHGCTQFVQSKFPAMGMGKRNVVSTFSDSLPIIKWCMKGIVCIYHEMDHGPRMDLLPSNPEVDETESNRWQMNAVSLILGECIKLSTCSRNKHWVLCYMVIQLVCSSVPTNDAFDAFMTSFTFFIVLLSCIVLSNSLLTDVYKIRYLCFPGGEGDCTNYRRPDHEKGYAPGFYQVGTWGSGS